MTFPAVRPKSLSDPTGEHADDPAELARILLKPDEEISIADCGVIFAKHIPAATLEEGIYFIPLCFKLMRAPNLFFDKSVCSSVFWFIRHHEVQICERGLMDAIKSDLRESVLSFLSDFRLVRMPETDLRLFGLSREFAELPIFSRQVRSILAQARQYPCFEGVIGGVLTELMARGSAGQRWAADIASTLGDCGLVSRDSVESNFTPHFSRSQLDFIHGSLHYAIGQSEREGFVEYATRIRAENGI